MEIGLFGAAALLYAASTGLGFAYLFSRDERLSQWMLRLLLAAVALHLGSFAARIFHFWAIPENRYFLPINSFFGALSFLAMSVAIVFGIVEHRHRLGILGAFVLPWCCIGSWGALYRLFAVGSTEIAGLVPALQSYWINIHPMVLMASYTIFANAFGVGLALLIQERQVKSKKPSELCYRLPSIEELDNLNYRLIAAAFPVLTVGIIMGGVWAHGAWGRFWGWDAKETWALITALVYAAYLHMRFVAGWRGRKAVYMSMFGFACVVFTLLGVNYLSELHGYLSQG